MPENKIIFLSALSHVIIQEKKGCDAMALAAREHWRDEKINGVIYDMSPAPGYQHGIINGNIYTKIKTGLRDSICLVTMENLDFKYHPDVNDDYVCPDIMVICDRKYLKGGAYSGVKKVKIMGGTVIETESEKLMRQGISQGEAGGRAE